MNHVDAYTLHMPRLLNDSVGVRPNADNFKEYVKSFGEDVENFTYILQWFVVIQQEILSHLSLIDVFLRYRIKALLLPAFLRSIHDVNSLQWSELQIGKPLETYNKCKSIK